MIAAFCLLVCGCNRTEEVSSLKPIPPTTTATATMAATETATETVTETTTEETTESTTERTTEKPAEQPTTEATLPAVEHTTKMTTAEKTTAASSSGSGEKTSNGHTVTVVDGVTYVDGVMIANKTYSLPASYCPGGLTAECDSAYDALKAGAAEAGFSLYISSGFRDYYTQQALYDRYVANDGKANADRYSARPGYSEHQTGLAIDLNGVLDSFGDTDTGKWVEAHCHEYGFILRYPRGKEAQTGYMYEPWHIRYVGKDVAAKIAKSGLCLEEYFGITSEYQN